MLARGADFSAKSAHVRTGPLPRFCCGAGFLTGFFAAALLPATKLKKELESFIYNVKVMLQLHKCRDAFWIGNLKHKNAAGKEVSSQLAPPSAVKGKGKGKKRKKDADGGGVPELHEIGDEEAEAGGDDAEPEVEEVDDEEDENEDDEDEDVDDEETEY